jgi:hypothetical protein
MADEQGAVLTRYPDGPLLLRGNFTLRTSAGTAMPPTAAATAICSCAASTSTCWS